MQALLGAYRWGWRDLRGELAGLAAAWLPCDPDDLIGPGTAIDETAQLKHGDATACVAQAPSGRLPVASPRRPLARGGNLNPRATETGNSL